MYITIGWTPPLTCMLSRTCTVLLHGKCIGIGYQGERLYTLCPHACAYQKMNQDIGNLLQMMPSMCESKKRLLSNGVQNKYRSTEPKRTVGLTTCSLQNSQQCRYVALCSFRRVHVASLVPRPRGRREDVFSPPTRPGSEARE